MRDAHVCVTCSCQCNFSYGNIPGYCTDCTLSIFIAWVCSPVKSLGTGLFFKWNRTKLVLSLLIDSLFAIHQWYNFMKSSLLWSWTILKLWLLVIRAVSPAYNLAVLQPMPLWRSLICNKKNNEPKTDPCGTPHDTVRRSDLIPFITVYWCRLVKYDLKEIICNSSNTVIF